MVLVTTNLLPLNEIPKLYREHPKEISTVSSNCLTERGLWGAWYRKNALARYMESCFPVEYRSNSVGARDEDFVEKNLIRLISYLMIRLQKVLGLIQIKLHTESLRIPLE